MEHNRELIVHDHFAGTGIDNFLIDSKGGRYIIECCPWCGKKLKLQDTYDVYFDQINASLISVNADSKKEAREKAIKVWKNRWSIPAIRTVCKQ